MITIGVDIIDLGIARQFRERECAQIHWDEYSYGTVETDAIKVCKPSK